MAQGKRCDDLEIEKRFDADTTEFMGVSHAGDADDDAEKDDRGDEHSDELDEAVAEWFE